MIGFPLGCCEVAEVQGLRPSSAAKADALCKKRRKNIIKTEKFATHKRANFLPASWVIGLEVRKYEKYFSIAHEFF